MLALLGLAVFVLGWIGAARARSPIGFEIGAAAAAIGAIIAIVGLMLLWLT